MRAGEVWCGANELWSRTCLVCEKIRVRILSVLHLLPVRLDHCGHLISRPGEKRAREGMGGEGWGRLQEHRPTPVVLTLTSIFDDCMPCLVRPIRRVTVDAGIARASLL